MDWSAPHAGLVLAAYCLSFAVLAGLVLWTVMRKRKLAAQLKIVSKLDRAP